MTTNDRIERVVSAWLVDDAAFRVPDHLDEVLAVTRETRQRPAWSSLERWLPVDTTFRPRLFTVPRAGRLAMVAALILLILALAILAVGAYRARVPDPFGIARNGAVVTSRDGDLYLLDSVTTEARQLAVGEGFDFSPIFSRDGTKMVFLRSDGPIAEPAILTLYVANADGSGARAITPPTESLDWFDWGPDGKRIAYMASGRLFVVTLGGSPPVELTGTGDVHFVTWLPPVGREIVFTRTGPSPAIFAIRPDGTGLRPISKTLALNEYDFQSLAVAPDGRHIGFTRWGGNGPRVYAVDVQNGSEMLFPTSGASGQREVIYSPDASLVAYTRTYRQGDHQVVVARADGSDIGRAIGPRMASRDSLDVEVSKAFTPDGTALIVRFGNDTAGATQLVPLDGSPPTNIEGSGGFEFVDVQRLAP